MLNVDRTEFDGDDSGGDLGSSARRREAIDPNVFPFSYFNVAGSPIMSLCRAAVCPGNRFATPFWRLTPPALRARLKERQTPFNPRLMTGNSTTVSPKQATLRRAILQKFHSQRVPDKAARPDLRRQSRMAESYSTGTTVSFMPASRSSRCGSFSGAVPHVILPSAPALGCFLGQQGPRRFLAHLDRRCVAL
jgi:hypothetical protein